jgi:hypothetical protein
MSKLLDWHFPLPRPHTGVPLGNGTQGLLVWGGGGVLKITIGRAGFWDHRGGNPFSEKTTYSELRRILENRDFESLRSIFDSGAAKKKLIPRQIGGGRLELHLAEGWEIEKATLDLLRGRIEVVMRHGERVETATLIQSPDTELAVLSMPESIEIASFKLRPSWEWVSGELAPLGIEPPDEWQTGHEAGFEQRLPEDDPLAVVVLRNGAEWSLGTHVGSGAKEAAREAAQGKPEACRQHAQEWWADYNQSIPKVSLPNADLQEMVDFGLYMQACCTPPQGLACTLQGPFLEEVRLPPWSADYHFNIIIEMIHAPALWSNRVAHCDPLWALLKSWLPQLKNAGERFFERSGAMLLPHAVDDRCQAVGAFWTGFIDQACTAWMALLCWDAYRHGGDEALLRELAWPLLTGAFEGYHAMADEKPDGSWFFPVSVSPEYKGARDDAWGRNASFQLAACHALLRALREAAPLVGQPLDPRWESMRTGLPLVQTGKGSINAEYPEKERERIFLWEGQDLDASHRHHSHLGGIYPFKTISADTHKALIRHSLEFWEYRGPGLWSGWCVPWAASIHAYCGNPDAAAQWLRIWKDVFTNAGRASIHDAAYRGFTNKATPPSNEGEKELMQLDGRFGALTAVFDLLVQEREERLWILPSLPIGWNRVSFDGLLAPGGFLLSAQLETTSPLTFKAKATRRGTLRVRLPDGRMIDHAMEAGESFSV